MKAIGDAGGMLLLKNRAVKMASVHGVGES